MIKKWFSEKDKHAYTIKKGMIFSWTLPTQSGVASREHNKLWWAQPKSISMKMMMLGVLKNRKRFISYHRFSSTSCYSSRSHHTTCATRLGFPHHFAAHDLMESERDRLRVEWKRKQTDKWQSCEYHSNKAKLLVTVYFIMRWIYPLFERGVKLFESFGLRCNKNTKHPIQSLEWVTGVWNENKRQSERHATRQIDRSFSSTVFNSFCGFSNCHTFDPNFCANSNRLRRTIERFSRPQ